MRGFHAATLTVLALLSARLASCRGEETGVVLSHSYPLIQDGNFSYAELTCSSAVNTCANISFELNGTDIRQRFSVSECTNGSVRFVLTQRYEGDFTCSRNGAISNQIALAAQPDYEVSGNRIHWVWLDPFNSRVTTHLVSNIKPGVLRERYSAVWSQYIPATRQLQNITPDAMFDLLVNVTTALNGSQYQLTVTINHNGSLEQMYLDDKIILYIGMNYSSGNSLLSHAEIVSISFFAPAVLTIVIVLLVLLAYVCYKYKCLKYKSTKNLGMERANFTMYYNSGTADYPPNNATSTFPFHSSHGSVPSMELIQSQYVGLGSQDPLLSTVIVNDLHGDISDNANSDVSVPQLSSIPTPFNEFNRDSIAVRLHSAIPEEVEEDEEERDREGFPISYMLESESDTEQGGSSFLLTPDDTLMSSVILISEEELKLTSEEPTHTNTLTTTEPTSGWHFDLGDPTTTPQHISSEDHAFGMFSQSSIDFDETNLGQYGCLPDHRYAHSASQISAAGDYSRIGLNDYSEDASQRVQHMRQKHKKRTKKERQQLATDRKSGDSGVGQSLSPEKSLSPRRVSLTQGAPPLSLGEDHDVDDVMKKPARHWSVSDPKTLHRKHRCNKRNSAVHTIGRSSDSPKKQHTYVPPNNSLSMDMASPSQPQPSGAAMVGLIKEGNHPRYVKSHRHSSSRHNNITETSSTLPLQSNRGVANIVPHASTLTRDELQQRLKEGANISEYSHTLPRRSKAGLKYRPSREKHHYHQQHPETYRSTGEHLHPEQETASVDFKDTFSSIQHSHHQSLSQTCSCKPSTEDTHTYTLPRKMKKKVKDKVGDDTLTIKHPQCEPQPEAGSTPPFKPPAAVIVPDCIRPTATLQECTSDGREYRDEANGFTLSIGKGAIAKGDKVTIDIGVALHGPFSYPEGTRPISPIFWICVRENEFYKFKKPVDITFQHFLSISSEEETARMGVSFVKAYHTPNHEGKYAFRKESDCQAFKPKSRYGTVNTTHFCYQCIVSNISELTLQNSNFCLLGTRPETFLYDRPMYIFFYVTFFLNACLETVRRQMAKSHELSHCKYSEAKTEFQFAKGVSPPSISIQCPQSLPGGWQLGIEFKTKISLEDIDFLARDRDDLHFKEDEGIYPPHFRVVIDGACTIEKATAHLNFAGTANDLVFDMHLVPPTLTKGPQSLSQTSLHQLQSPTHLPPLRLSQLTKLIISKIPGQWKWFGTMLEVPESDQNFDTFPTHDAKECFRSVVMSWKRCGMPEFTWETVLEVLVNLSENRLAMKVRSELMSHHVPSPYYQQVPALSCPDNYGSP